MKVSYINGVCIKNDAISNSIRDEVFRLMSMTDYDVQFVSGSC